MNFTFIVSLKCFLNDLHLSLSDYTADWNLGISTTRYPRTKPNDLAILRLKGFLKKGDGNNAIVNDFDVLNIFEGDYDVDTIDYFWGMDKSSWGHIDRTKQHWVSTINSESFISILVPGVYKFCFIGLSSMI